MAQKQLLIDGKPVRKFLFARYSRVILSGSIPVDKKERASALAQSEQPRFLVLAQVEAFNVDHAINRLQNDLFPMIPRADWEMIEELDPEHELGKMGSTHPLIPLQHAANSRVQ